MFPLWPSKFIKCCFTFEGFLVFHKIYFTSSQLEVYSYYRNMFHVFANVFIRSFAFWNWNKCPIYFALIKRIPKRKLKGHVCNYHWKCTYNSFVPFTVISWNTYSKSNFEYSLSNRRWYHVWGKTSTKHTMFVKLR